MQGRSKGWECDARTLLLGGGISSCSAGGHAGGCVHSRANVCVGVLTCAGSSLLDAFNDFYTGTLLAGLLC